MLNLTRLPDALDPEIITPGTPIRVVIPDTTKEGILIISNLVPTDEGPPIFLQSSTSNGDTVGLPIRARKTVGFVVNMKQELYIVGPEAVPFVYYLMQAEGVSAMGANGPLLDLSDVIDHTYLEAYSSGISELTIGAEESDVIRVSGSIVDQNDVTIADSFFLLLLIKVKSLMMTPASVFNVTSGDGGNTGVTSFGSTGRGAYQISTHTNGTFDLDITDVVGGTDVQVDIELYLISQDDFTQLPMRAGDNVATALLTFDAV